MADKYLQHGDPAPVVVAKEVLDEVASQFSIAGEHKRRQFEDELRAGLDVLLGEGELPASEFSGAVREYYERIRTVIAENPRSRRDRRKNPEGSVALAMKLSRKLAHEIRREDIFRAALQEGDVIQNSLNYIFTAYKVDQFIWAHTKGESSRESFQVLISQYSEMIRPPWFALREKLDEMRDAAGNPELFNFEFSDPEVDRISFVNHSRYYSGTRIIPARLLKVGGARVGCRIGLGIITDCSRRPGPRRPGGIDSTEAARGWSWPSPSPSA